MSRIELVTAERAPLLAQPYFAGGDPGLGPELTITADGAFWSPFGPTVVGGRLDTDLLVTRQTRPLRVPAEALVRVIGATGYTGPVDDRFT